MINRYPLKQHDDVRRTRDFWFKSRGHWAVRRLLRKRGITG